MATLTEVQFRITADTSAFETALTRLVEANAALRKRRALAKPERELEAAMAKAFRAQGRAFLSRLALLKGRFPPAVREVAEAVAWEPLFDEAALETLQAFQGPLDEFTAKALSSGMLAAVAELNIETAFDLKHPAAVDYLRQRGAERVTQITETTRTGLRTILTQGADEGWSYQKTAKAIRERYADFSATRARNIAVYELGDGYEAGNRLIADDLKDAGLAMEKSWLSAGDAKTRPAHRANDNAGWIDIDAAFPSGHDRPPTDPRCRCSTLYRRKPSERPAVSAPPPAPAGGFDRAEWNKDRTGLYDTWRAQASDDEAAAVTRYKGARYQGINRMLRTGNAPASQVADLKKDVRLIDKALSKATVDRDVQAFRGVRFDWDSIPDSWAKMKPGDVITDPGYVSTSTSSKASEKFAKKSNGSFLLDVTIPKDSPGLWIDPLGDAQTKEDEILLPRGTKFLVRDVTKERNGRTKVKVEVVR